MAFSDETFDFLHDLEKNNNKAWFDGERARYETYWKAAALDTVAELSTAMAALDPPLKAVPKLNGSLRRINRDVRFSKDKSPYNAHLHLVFWIGDHPNRSPGVHFVLSGAGVGYGAGQWGIEPARLKELRHRILDGADGAALMSALDRAAEIGCRMGSPDLARLPKGFEAEGRAAELLRYKGFVARTRDNIAPKTQLLETPGSHGS